MKQKHAILLLLAAFFVALVAGQVLAVYPDGVVNYTILKTETRNKTTPVNITAYGGNITWLRIDATQQTKRWQGFVGNMSGSLVLDDAANNTMYSWNLSNVTGEIYASTNCSLDWNLVSPQNDCSIDNYITGTGSDSASKTYTPSSNSNTYQILSMVINASSTCAAYPYVNSSAQSTFFENIILAAGANASTTNQTIYAATIDGATEPNGFNGEQFDYQMLVPANGTTGTVYCLYAEIN